MRRKDENKEFIVRPLSKIGYCKNIIFQKVKADDQVTESFKNEMNKVAANSVENVGKGNPKKAAAFLATLLVTMTLAACEGEIQQGENGDKTQATETMEETTEDTYTFPADLEIPEHIENFDGKEYGFGTPFSALDFNEWIREGAGTDGFAELEEDFGQYESYRDIKDIGVAADYAIYRNGLVLAGIDKENERRNIALVLDLEKDEESNGWKHTFVSTSDDLAVVSEDADGNFYLTGLVDGEIRSDAGFMDEDTYKYTYKMVDKYGYDEALARIRKEFFGIFAVKSVRTSSVFNHYVAFVSDFGYDETTNEFSVSIYYCSPIGPGSTNSVIHSVYDVPENCIEQIVSGEMTFERETEEPDDEYLEEDFNEEDQEVDNETQDE